VLPRLIIGFDQWQVNLEVLRSVDSKMIGEVKRCAAGTAQPKSNQQRR
jgi:hypothetical protein